jgi:hypothetical protein
MTFAFPDAPPPVGSGTVTIIGTLDSGTPDKYLALYTESALPYASVFGFGSACAPNGQNVSIDTPTLQRMQLQDGITLQLQTAATTNCMCATNELYIRLQYTRGPAATFTP